MEPRIFEFEKDFGKAQFQEELSRWFESRGIIADLRSHLRHLMVLALQSAQAGLKPTDKSSPKAQALNLIVAEYLFRHRCHYTLSVFTSEVPTLANFHPSIVYQGGKSFDANKKKAKGKCFEDDEVEEIFSALGICSREEEITLLKARYLEKTNDFSLVELFLQTVVEMSRKLQIRQNLKSCEVEEERFLSKEWSSRIVNILLNEKLASPQVIALEEAIFRTTENEIRRIMDEERRIQMQLLSERERRIQEYLKKHEDEILLRLIEAEKDLTTRKDIIVEELIEREKHLTKMVMEWKNKHEEILKLSKNFHSIENENRDLQKKLKAFEEENLNLKTQGKVQSKTTGDLQEEMNSLINKLKEVTDSNATLSERIQALISRENKEVFVLRDNANQKTARVNIGEIPLLWSKNMTSDHYINPVIRHSKNSEPKQKSKEFTVKNPALPHPDEWSLTELGRTHLNSGDAKLNKGLLSVNTSEDENVSLSSSSEEIILSMRKRLQDLEEETNRINHHYLEYKLKYVPVESDSDGPRDPSSKSPPNVPDEIVIKETKFSQTNMNDTFTKIQKLKELKEGKINFGEVADKKSDEIGQTKPSMRTPTKRQLRHRDFFLKSRQLLQTLEKQNVGDLDTSPSIMKSHSSSPGEELTESYKKSNKKSPLKSNLSSPSDTSSARSESQKLQAESEKNALIETSTHLLNGNLDCLALLEETRIKSPKISDRRSLRQHILLSEPEKEKTGKNEEIIKNCFEFTVVTPDSISSRKAYERDGFL